MTKNLLPLVLIFLISRPALAFSLQLDADSLVIPSTGSKTPYKNIHSLMILDGAPANLFDSPPLQFPNVKKVGLSAPSYVDYHLKYMAKNYSWLERLSINQTEMLTDDNFKQLKNIRLHALGFDCPLESPQGFASTIPKTLTLLYLGPHNNITERSDVFLSLPNLSVLDIRGTKLKNDFLSNSNCPNLEELDLINVKVDEEKLKGLENFPKLKKVSLYGTILDENTMQLIKTKKIKIQKYYSNH